MNILITIIFLLIILIILKKCSYNSKNIYTDLKKKFNFFIDDNTINETNLLLTKKTNNILSNDLYNQGINNDIDRYLDIKSKFDYSYNNEDITEKLEINNLNDHKIKDFYDNLITDYKKNTEKKNIILINDNEIIYENEKSENNGKINDNLSAFDKLDDFSEIID
jgi:hypothetical protein